MADMTGWTYLLTFGYTSALYAKGNARRMVDKDTGDIVVEYTV